MPLVSWLNQSKEAVFFGEYPCDNHSQSIEEAKIKIVSDICGTVSIGARGAEFKAPEQEIYKEYIYRTGITWTCIPFSEYWTVSLHRVIF